MARLALLACLGALLLLSSMAFSAGLRANAAETTEPVVVLWRSSDRQSAGGLITAVWADGTVLHGPGYTGRKDLLFLVKANPKQVADTLAILRSAKLEDHVGQGGVVPDASHSTLRVSIDGKLCTLDWHENINPGFGGDLNTDPKYRNFVEVWLKARGAVLAIAPLSVERLMDQPPQLSTFRGYDMKDPDATPWSPRGSKKQTGK